MALKTEFSNIQPYQTKDGSEIRELMHPEVHGNREQSLAEATIRTGSTTHLHRHEKSEELYHITMGQGIMIMGEEQFEVSPGDTVCIRPGEPHQVRNIGKGPLKILCCCSPPYSHQDTKLL